MAVRELVTMWRHSRMIALTALSAGLYAAVLIPFKPFPLIPGITEIRVAQVLPPVLSLLFGPAAAWGTAVGNLIGDMVGGTFGPGSLFGFVGNFFLGLIRGPSGAGSAPSAAGKSPPCAIPGRWWSSSC